MRPDNGRAPAQRSSGAATEEFVMDCTSRTRVYVYDACSSSRSDHGRCTCAVTDHEYPPDRLRRSTTSENVLPPIDEGRAAPVASIDPYIARPCGSTPTGSPTVEFEKLKSDRILEYNASTLPVTLHGSIRSTASDARSDSPILRFRSTSVTGP